tara:strand:- start:487 stop:1161 length:675 start_codon:yes stop_codon:yes gene_type:complete
MSEFASFLDIWRKAGVLPPEGTPFKKLTHEQEAEVTAKVIRQNRMERFKLMCPPEFQKKIDEKLIENPTAWAEADKWEGSFPGLWLWSNDTGRAKTRMLWRKFGALHVNQGKVVARITGLNLAEEYHDAFNRNRTSEFYGQFSKMGVVMLDDLDKMPLPHQDASFSQSDQGMRNARFLRELFDKFYENHVPVLVTANENIKFFAERIGPSAERRMREVCKEISF